MFSIEITLEEIKDILFWLQMAIIAMMLFFIIDCIDNLVILGILFVCSLLTGAAHEYVEKKIEDSETPP